MRILYIELAGVHDIGKSLFGIKKKKKRRNEIRKKNKIENYFVYKKFI